MRRAYWHNGVTKGHASENAGCGAVILGCTEIPLLMNDANSPLPILDSTRLLARTALHRPIQNTATAA